MRRTISILFITGLIFCGRASALEHIDIKMTGGVPAVLVQDDYYSTGNVIYPKTYTGSGGFCDKVPTAHYRTGKNVGIDDLSSIPVATLVICSGDVNIRIHSNGIVDFTEGLSLPEASAAFWKEISVAFPHFKEKIIADYLKEKDGK